MATKGTHVDTGGTRAGGSGGGAGAQTGGGRCYPLHRRTCALTLLFEKGFRAAQAFVSPRRLRQAHLSSRTLVGTRARPPSTR